MAQMVLINPKVLGSNPGYGTKRQLSGIIPLQAKQVGKLIEIRQQNLPTRTLSLLGFLKLCLQQIPNYLSNLPWDWVKQNFGV